MIRVSEEVVKEQTHVKNGNDNKKHGIFFNRGSLTWNKSTSQESQRRVRIYVSFKYGSLWISLTARRVTNGSFHVHMVRVDVRSRSKDSLEYL